MAFFSDREFFAMVIASHAADGTRIVHHVSGDALLRLPHMRRNSRKEPFPAITMFSMPGTTVVDFLIK